MAQPLYTTLDALNTLDYFGRAARYGEALDVAAGVRATFFDAGHILGSASIRLQLEEGARRCSLVFSGDVGNSGRPLLRDPVVPPKSDVLVIETTYGDRLHKPLQPSVEELYQAIEDTFRRGGNVVIPTFALERAQEVLYYLRDGVGAGRLPRTMQVFLDSPMAISATEIFRRHPECYDAETAALFHQRTDPFNLPGLHFTRETAESMALNRITGGAVILAGSGMATGGRVRHHLKHNLWRENSSVIFVGFAARGTLARQIIDGASAVQLFGEEVPVRAHLYTINGFSAHADQAELARMAAASGRTTYVPGSRRGRSDAQVRASAARYGGGDAGAWTGIRALTVASGGAVTAGGALDGSTRLCPIAVSRIGAGAACKRRSRSALRTVTNRFRRHIVHFPSTRSLVQ